MLLSAVRPILEAGRHIRGVGVTAAIASSDKCFWVIVADESKALVYARDSKSGPLRELFAMHNEVARRKRGDLVSDREGRSFDSRGMGRHAMTEEKSDPKRHAAEALARLVAKRVAKVLNHGTCRGYALIAAPRFLGELRDALEAVTSTPPYLTIDKDIVDKDMDTIEKLIAKNS